MIKKKLTLEEQISRFKKINVYNKVLSEQEETPEPAPEEQSPVDDSEPSPAPVDDLPSDEIPAGDTPVDDTTMDEPPLPDDMGDSEGTEEIDITDLVNLTKSIKNDLDDQKKQPIDDKTDQILSRLDSFNGTMSKLDMLVSKIEQMDMKLDNLKEPTPVEKLEMRSLDSYPFKSNPTQFFDEKQREMEMSGKNEYVLTKDDIQNYSPSQIVKSFNPDNERNNVTY